MDSISAGKKELKGNAETVSRIWKRAQSWGDWAPWMGPTASMVAGRAAGVMKAAMRAATHASENPERMAKIREILEHACRDLEDLG